MPFGGTLGLAGSREMQGNALAHHGFDKDVLELAMVMPG